MKNFIHTIREMFKPIPFNPIPSPEDLVCTHEGFSNCPVKWPEPDPRTGVMSFDNGGETVWPNG